MQKEVIVNVLELLVNTDEPLTVKDLANRLEISYRRAYRAVKLLQSLSLLRITKKGIEIDKTLTSMISYLTDKYDISKIVNKKYIMLLGVLLDAKSLVDLFNEINISEKTLREKILDLLNSGVIVEKNGKYEIREDPILRTFIHMIYHHIARVEPYANVVYKGQGILIKKCRKGLKCKGTLTAFSVFRNYGIEIETPWDYYLQPRKEISIEEIIVHSFLVAKTNYERSLIVLLYAKNYGKISKEKLKKLALDFNVFPLITKMEKYLAGRDLPDIFIPLRELDELAKIYHININRFRAKRFSIDFLEKIGKLLKKEIKAFLIGGGAMVFRGYKYSTRDIDIVVMDVKDSQELINAIKALGYNVVARCKIVVLEDKGPKIYIYVRSINKKYIITKRILQRAEKILLGNLRLYIAHDTDLLIMKALTKRIRDYEDVKILIRKGKIDWKTLVEEVKEQDQLTGYPVSFNVLTTLELVEKELRTRIKYKRKLKSIALKSMIKYAYFKLNKKTIRELQRIIKYPEPTIRKKLKDILRETT